MQESHKSMKDTLQHSSNKELVQYSLHSVQVLYMLYAKKKYDLLNHINIKVKLLAHQTCLFGDAHEKCRCRNDLSWELATIL